MCFNYKPHEKKLVQQSPKFMWAEPSGPSAWKSALILQPTWGAEEGREDEEGRHKLHENIPLPCTELNFPGYCPPGTCHPHPLQAEVTQAKPEQQLMLISNSPVLCFLLLKKRVPHLLLLRSEWNSLCTAWHMEAFGFFGTVLWSVDVYTIALRTWQGTVLAMERYFIGTNLNLSLPFTEQHLRSDSASALNIVTVLSVTEKAWLLIPPFSA